MKLSTIDPGNIEIEIRHPGTFEPTGLVMKAISPHDAGAARARRAFQDKANRKRSPEQREQDTVEFLAALVTGWEWKGDASWDDKKLAFNLANVKTVLSKPWIRSQVDEEIGELSAFFRS